MSENNGQAKTAATATPSGAAEFTITSEIRVPSGWTAQHRNVRIWQTKDSANDWFIDAISDGNEIEWRQTAFNADNGPVNIHFTGAVKLTQWRSGKNSFERRARLSKN